MKRYVAFSSLFTAALLSAPTLTLAMQSGDNGFPLSAQGVSGRPKALLQPAAETPIYYDHGNPSSLEQLMLELINRARANPGAEAARLGIDLNQGLTPGTLADTPKQPLAFHPFLIQAARAHSEWMLLTHTFQHSGSGGSSPGDRMQDAGYIFSGQWSWGENIGWGGTSGSVDPISFTVARHDSLFISPGHRTNIANDTFDELGTGIAQGVFTTPEGTWNALMATQKFARSDHTPGPLLVGVVFEDINASGFYDPGEGLPGIRVSQESGEWYTETSHSGGYAVPYPAGSGILEITFSGGELTEPQTRLVLRTGKNIKLDLDASRTPEPVEVIPGSLQFITSSELTLEARGEPGAVFELFYSSDLLDWVSIGAFTLNENGLSTLYHAPQNEETSHFYRLRR